MTLLCARPTSLTVHFMQAFPQTRSVESLPPADMNHVCWAAQRAPAILLRIKKVLEPPGRLVRVEAVVGPPPAVVRRLIKEAGAVYNVPFMTVNAADTATVAESHIAFRNSSISIGSMTGGRYGQKAAVLPDARFMTATQSGTVTTTDHSHVNLSRNAGVLAMINTILDTLVVAGNVDIDPTVSHLAGGLGRVFIGTAHERQLHFDLATARKVNSVFTALSGVIGPKDLASAFAPSCIERVNEAMQALTSQPVPCITVSSRWAK